MGTPSPTATPIAVAEPDWSLEPSGVEDDDLRQGTLAKVRDRYVLLAGMQLRGISTAGKQTWKRTFPGAADYDRLDVTVSGGVLIAAYRHPKIDTWPHPNVVEAVDSKNGRTLWKINVSPYQTVIGDTPILPRAVPRGPGHREPAS
jgi:hypothetical protein